MSLTPPNSKSDESHTKVLQDIKNKEETSNSAKNSPQTPNKNATDSKDTPQSSSVSPAAQALTKTDECLIKQVSTREEYEKLIASIKDKYILVWFSAAWCGLCRQLATKFHDLAEQYRNQIKILKIDVDDLDDLTLENGVTTIPSYMIMRNGQKLDFYYGSEQEKINELIEKYLKEKTG